MLSRTFGLALLAMTICALPAGSAAARRLPHHTRPALKHTVSRGKAPARPASHRSGGISGALDTPSDALVELAGTTPSVGSESPFTDTINWTKRVITVMGIGVSPDRGALLVRRKVAQAYALDDAMRELSDIVDRIRVNGDATVDDLAVSDDDIRAAVNERIAQAQTTDTHVLPDGSVEVTVQMPLFGQDGLAGAVLHDEPSPIVFAADASSSVPVGGSPYTGIILDARNTGAQPALAPSIRSIDGQGLASRPPVAYVHTMGGAVDIAGTHTLRLTVERCAGSTHSDLLVSDAGLQQLKQAWAKGGVSVVIIL